MASKRKIVYAGGFELPDKNAAAQRVMANARLLRDMGFEVEFIGVTRDPAHAAAVADGFRVTNVAYPQSAVQWLWHIVSFCDMRMITGSAPDYVVLYNFPAVASLRILGACHKRGIRVVHDLTEWETAEGWAPRTLIRKADICLRMHVCMKKMDGVIAISRYLYDYYRVRTRTILVPPTVDLTQGKWNRQRELTVGSPVRLVYAGSAGFGRKDRLDRIIDAMEGKQRLHLTVIGMTREQYEQGYGRKVPASVNVEFRGRVSHEEAVKAVCDADFQMLIREDTLKNRAGFPTKLVESMSCCTPLIATETSNITDYIKDSENGILVSEMNPLELVMVNLGKMPEAEILKMKEACRGLKDFDYRQYKTEFSAVFE